ncbi:hypothetical protein Cni_G10985 [Canna indica]|uniref:DUF7054 domain-containing protein n=1 Tax=Canna indica TaxID=4628 RepID=A0AAQ3QAE7_9LILI|nr:hypothetical protein Cni_G10985 [Canna indica]
MAPASSPSSSQPRNLRIGLEERSALMRKNTSAPERAASFHGRTTPASPPDHRLMRRPKTQPELLARLARGGAAGTTSPPTERRVPAKVLVNVTVQRSLGPVQVVACTDWTVGDLVAAAVRRYVKEGRRPTLPTAEPSAFALHYSQFSLESLNPEEKLINLGSRNFFLCLKPAPAASEIIEVEESEAAASSSSSAAGSCSKQAEKATKTSISWLSFMDCLL